MRIQTTFTVTFNPDPDAARGKIIGSTFMFIGIGTIYLNMKSNCRFDKIEQKKATPT
jgi:hypothetical protein